MRGGGGGVGCRFGFWAAVRGEGVRGTSDCRDGEEGGGPESSQVPSKKQRMLRSSRRMGIRGRLGESWRAFAQAFRSPVLRRLRSQGPAPRSQSGPTRSRSPSTRTARTAQGPSDRPFRRWGSRPSSRRGSRSSPTASRGAGSCSPWTSRGPLSSRHGVDRGRRRAVAPRLRLRGPSSSVISTAFNPAEAALLPTLATTPEELTASNPRAQHDLERRHVRRARDRRRLPRVRRPVARLRAHGCLLPLVCDLRVRPAPDTPPESPGTRRDRRELLAGFRAIGEDRHLQVVVGLIGAQMLVAGALEVIIVVEAIRVLDAGNAGVGWLNTALGVGGLLGGLVGVVLTARKRLAGDFGSGSRSSGSRLPLLPPGATSRSRSSSSASWASAARSST